MLRNGRSCAFGRMCESERTAALYWMENEQIAELACILRMTAVTPYCTSVPYYSASCQKWHDIADGRLARSGVHYSTVTTAPHCILHVSTCHMSIVRCSPSLPIVNVFFLNRFSRDTVLTVFTSCYTANPTKVDASRKFPGRGVS